MKILHILVFYITWLVHSHATYHECKLDDNLLNRMATSHCCLSKTSFYFEKIATFLVETLQSQVFICKKEVNNDTGVLYFSDNQKFDKYFQMTKNNENGYNICMSSTDLTRQWLPEGSLYNLNLTEDNVQEFSVYGSQTFPFDFYVHAPSLKVVNLQGFNCSKIKFSEETMKSITKFTMSKGNIFFQSMSKYFENFTSLEMLNLSNSMVTPEIDLYNNITLPSIKEVDLTNTQIKVMDDDSLSIFPSITHLYLARNSIQKINKNVFLRLNNIISVNMSQSFNLGAKKLSLQFTNKDKMNYVDLFGNKLKSIDIFFGKGVQSINLSHNILSKEISLKCCSTNDCIRTVILQNNDYEIHQETFTSFYSIENIDLKGYKLNCLDCNLINSTEIRKFINKTNTKFIFHTDDNLLTCTEPKSFRNYYINDTDIIATVCEKGIPYRDWETNKTVIISLLVTFITFIILIAGVIYKYRFEISYWIQYVKLKKRKVDACQCDPEGYEHDAFISYSAADRRWVWTVLRPGLEESEQKYRLCLHERDFLLGTEIQENVEISMRTSRYSIMILSNDFVASQWCRWEMELASSKLVEENREFLIIIQLEPLDTVHIPSHLKHLISTRTFIDWDVTKFSNEFLLKRLKNALGKSIFEKNLQSRAEISENEFKNL